jgi:hypothetical protein
MPLGHPDATTITLCSIGGADLVFRSTLKAPDGAAEGPFSVPKRPGRAGPPLAAAFK